MTDRPELAREEHDELLALVARARWQFATTYAKTAPHEYVVRAKHISPEDFASLAVAIRDHGYHAPWVAVRSRNVTKGLYLVIGPHRYWWMRTIINRAPLEDETP